MDNHKLGSIKMAVGYDCNLKCGFCLQLRKDKSPKLDIDLVDKIMQEDMVQRDVKRYTITGGEPTYAPYKDITLHIVNQAHVHGKETCIFTNGTLLNDETLKEFKEAGLTRFRVSLYDPVDWNWLRDLMNKFDKYGFPKMVKYTVTKENITNIIEVLVNIVDIGVDWFQTKPYNRVEVEEVDERHELSPYQVKFLSMVMLEFRKKNPEMKVDLLPLCYEFLVDESIESNNISPCNCGQGKDGYLVVTPNGDVKICGAYPVALGNIAETKITKIWEESQLLKDVRNRTQPEECNSCKHWAKCSKNDCHSATFAKYGNFDHANPQCPIIRKRELVTK